MEGIGLDRAFSVNEECTSANWVQISGLFLCFVKLYVVKFFLAAVWWCLMHAKVMYSSLPNWIFSLCYSQKIPGFFIHVGAVLTLVTRPSHRLNKQTSGQLWEAVWWNWPILVLPLSQGIPLLWIKIGQFRFLLSQVAMLFELFSFGKRYTCTFVHEQRACTMKIKNS